ncbi:hypothetical protein RZS08_18025, partial [Arthrospira platensis SPKY1]|nr:hypothetical protein [Arthrospira platensis SPKY1]
MHRAGDSDRARSSQCFDHIGSETPVSKHLLAPRPGLRRRRCGVAAAAEAWRRGRLDHTIDFDEGVPRPIVRMRRRLVHVEHRRNAGVTA